MKSPNDAQKKEVLADADLNPLPTHKKTGEPTKAFLDSREKARKPTAPQGKANTIARLVGLLLVAAAGYAGWTWWSQPNVSQAPKVAVTSVPVDAAIAAKTDVPVYFGGLGTVQAFNTVSVKTRVDGQIQTVAFTEGQHVKAGDLLVQIDPRPYQATYDQAIAKKAQDEAQLGNAKLDLGRYTELAKKNFSTRQQLDTQTALVAQLEATIRADAGAIDAAKVQLDYTKIVSPIDGVAGIRQIDIGNIVHAADSTAIVVVTQLQPLSVIFTLPEEQRQQVADAMKAGPVQVTALARDGTTVLDKGTLLLIDNEIDQGAGTVRLKATFPNAQEKLWPGQFINVRLLLQTQQNVLTIPSAAVNRGPEGFYAYVVKPDATVDMRGIKLGQDVNNLTVVEEGLVPGEQVVTGGQYRLQPGSHVAVNPPKPVTAASVEGTTP